MKNIKRPLAVIAALSLTASMAVTAFAASTPKADGQNKNNWCWATAAKVVGENNGGAWHSSDAVVLTNTDGLHSTKALPTMA